MKVAWIHRFDPALGGGVFMYQLADYLKEGDIDLQLIYVKKLNIFNVFSIIKNLREQLKDVDIVHAQYGSGTGFVTSFLPGFKILTLRGTDWYRYYGRTMSQKLKGILIWILTRVSLSHYDAIIAMSQAMKASIEAWSKKTPVVVMPSGINLSLFKEYSQKVALEKLGMKKNDDEKWILFSSVMDNNPVKRPQIALNTVKELQKNSDVYKLKYMHGIEHQNVVFFINCCDVVLLTSTHEGWPNIVKEALACNVPFVSTDVSDLNAIAKKTKSCFVCEPEPTLLSHFISKSLLMPKENLRSHIEFMEIEASANELLKFYQKAILKNG